MTAYSLVKTLLHHTAIFWHTHTGAAVFAATSVATALAPFRAEHQQAKYDNMLEIPCRIHIPQKVSAPRRVQKQQRRDASQNREKLGESVMKTFTLSFHNAPPIYLPPPPPYRKGEIQWGFTGVPIQFYHAWSANHRGIASPAL